MRFDDFYETVGVFGTYQKVKYFLLCFTNMLPPVMVYAWTFIAATPSFHCKTPMDIWSDLNCSNVSVSWSIPTDAQCRTTPKLVSLKECQRCFQMVNITDGNFVSSQLSQCKEFEYDRTFFESTLVEEWSMVCDRVSIKSTVQIVFFAGYMVGSLVFGILSDKYGRRPIMGVSFVLMFIAGIVCALAPQDFIGYGASYPLFALGRFFLACATRGISITGFVIGSEIAGPKQRLFAGIVIKYFFAFGEFLLLGIALSIRSWKTLNAVLAVVPVPFIFFYFILPESPRWLISKQRYDDAETLLQHIAEKNRIHFNHSVYKHFVTSDRKRVAAQTDQGSKYTAIFRSKVMSIIALNMSYQWFVQNMVFYGISQNTGSWMKDPYKSFAIGAVAELIGYAIVHLTLDRLGRKLTYCLFVISLTIVAMLVAPIQIFLEKNSLQQQILMFVINVTLKLLSSGSYVIIYIYANETFPTEGRNTGMGICSMIARVGAIIGTFSNDHLTRAWAQFPIILYGASSLLAVILASVFPETLNKPLPQNIDDVEKMGLSCSFRIPKPKEYDHSNRRNDVGQDLLREESKDDIDS